MLDYLTAREFVKSPEFSDFKSFIDNSKEFIASRIFDITEEAYPKILEALNSCPLMFANQKNKANESVAEEFFDSVFPVESFYFDNKEVFKTYC